VKLTPRLLLLCLLAVLLPLRSALAFGFAGAEAPCHTAEMMMADAEPMHGEMGLDEAAPAPCHDAAGPAGACDHCSACTLATALIGPPVGLSAPIAAAALRYPPLLAPAPRHLAEGPERPPRSC
jgi:hypothetical protein